MKEVGLKSVGSVGVFRSIVLLPKARYVASLAAAAALSMISVVTCRIDTVSADTFLKEGAPDLGHGAADGVAAPQTLPNFATLSRTLSPAVVNISVEAEADEDAAEAPIPGIPFLKRDPSQPAKSLGSGFIVNEDGFIVTNNHVVEKSDKIIVRLLDDKTEYPATLVGRDVKTDLALIKITPTTKLKTVFLGNSEDIEVGEWVLAIGNQFQLGQTVTVGIVSAKSRRVPTKASGPYDAFIQTDASINPGSSGGPLFNIKGQVIGINTAIFSPGRAQFGGTGFNIGIGFAIPINLVKGIVTQLRTFGKVTRGMLGVIIQRVDPDVAEALALSSPDGALVADIIPNTPASKAGFERRDVIISYEGQPIRDHEDLPLLVANTAIGTTVKIEVLRAGQRKTLTTTIEELKETVVQKEQERPKSDLIGLVVQDMTEEIAKSLNVPDAHGVIINNVMPNSPADKAGMSRGDIIEEFAGQPVKDSEQFDRLIRAIKKDTPILVLVRRAEGTRFLTLRVSSKDRN